MQILKFSLFIFQKLFDLLKCSVMSKKYQYDVGNLSFSISFPFPSDFIYTTNSNILKNPPTDGRKASHLEIFVKSKIKHNYFFKSGHVSQ